MTPAIQDRLSLPPRDRRPHLSQLNPQQLRETVLALAGTLANQQTEIERKDGEIAFKQAVIDKLTHEMAVLKRLKFAAQSEAYNAEQKSLLDEAIDTGLAPWPRRSSRQRRHHKAMRTNESPSASRCPAHLPRREIQHEPENTTWACGCQLKRIGQDVAEKLNYQPDVFAVERHIRGKWVQAPVAAHIIDKGIPPPASWPRCR